MKNNTSAKRFSRILILALSLCLVVTAVPAVLFGFAPSAAAVEDGCSTVAGINTSLNAGNNVKLTGNITMGDYGSDKTQITVPASYNGYIDLNGFDIVWTLPAGQLGVFTNGRTNGGTKYTLINNQGTLRIKNSSAARQAKISLYLDSGDLTCDFEGREYTGAMCAIRNSGNLTIDQKIEVESHNQFHFENQDGNGKYVDNYLEAIAIWQTAGSLTSSASITAYSHSKTCYTGYVFGSHNSYNYVKAYGIYASAGTVRVDATGSLCKFNIESSVDFVETSNEPDKSRMKSTAVGIYTAAANCFINGPQMDIHARYSDCDDGTSGGSFKDGNATRVDAVAVAYKDNAPTVSIGTNANCHYTQRNYDGDNTAPTYMVKSVMRLASAPLMQMNGSTPPTGTDAHLTESGTATYYDDNGRTLTPGGATALYGGMYNDTTAKTCIVYRYWNPGFNTLLGYSLRAGSGTADDGYAYRNAAVTLSGNTNPWLTAGGTLQYSSGGLPTNQYYYTLRGISYYTVQGGNGRPASWTTTKGTDFAKFSSGTTTSLNNTTTAATAKDNMYIYVDYVAKTSDQVRVNLASAVGAEDVTTARMTYTGAAAVPGTDFEIGVFSENYTADLRTDDANVTGRYNINGSNTYVNCSYSYGATAENYNINGLPSSAGTYFVKMVVANDTTYTRYATTNAHSYNRNGTTFYFTLIIEKKAPVITGPDTATMTYGSTIGSIDTSGFSVSAPNCTVTPSGTWSWQNASQIPNVGTTTATLVWTPTSGYAANFTSVTKTVNVTVGRKNLTVTPLAKTITYGDSMSLTIADFNIQGLVYDTAEYKTAVFNELIPHILIDGASYYQGKPIGTYVFTGSGDLNNYIVTYNSSSLTITQRPLYLAGYASDRGFNGSDAITVSFPTSNITGNIPADVIGVADGIIVSSVTGSVSAPAGGSPGDVGENLLVTFPIPSITGAKAGNYKIEAGYISNFTSLRVNISKATPVVALPTLPTVVYDSTKTLNGHFANAVTGVFADSRDGETAGVWTWKNTVASTVPTVTNYGYTAVFTPTSENFAVAEYTVPVTVTKREITVAVSSDEIYYGDNVPVFVYSFTGFTNTNPASPDAQFVEVNGQQIDARGFTLGGTMPNIIDYGGYSVGSNAGHYNINFTQALTADNYSFVTDNTSVLVVNKRPLTIKALDKRLTYGDNAPLQTDYQCSFSGFVLGETESIFASYGAVNFACSYAPGSGATTVGYPIVPSGLSTHPNYEYNYVNGKLTVDKATLTVKADSHTVTYGSAVPALTYSFSGFKASDTQSVVAGLSSLVIVTDYTTTSSVDEIYTVTINVSSLSADNYIFVGTNGTITVNKATCTVSAWPTAELTFEDTLGDAVFTSAGSSSVPGVFSFVTPTDVPEYSDSNSTAFLMVFTPSNTNYYNVTGSITVTVNKRPITGTPSIQGSLMVGSVVTANLDSMNPSSSARYTYQWYVDGVAVASATSQQYSIADTDEDKILKVTVTAKATSAYTGSASFTTVDVISPSLPAPELTDLTYTIPVGIVYNRQTHAVNVYANNEYIGDVTVRYNNSISAPVNAGTYNVTVDISQGITYGPVSGLSIGTMTISPAPIRVTFLANDKVYDGRTTATIDPTTINYVGRISGDDVSLNTSAAMYEFDSAAAGVDKNVLMTGAILEGAQRENYEVVLNDVVATIEPKNVTVDAQTVTRVYNPDNNYVDLIFTTPSGILTADRAYVSIVNGKGVLENNGAGNRTITSIEYDVTGAKAANYNVTVENENELTVNISKATPSVTPPTPAPITYSGTTTLQFVTLGANWTWDNASEIPQVINSGYAATYTPNDTNNYYTVGYTIPLTVNKAEAIITVNNVTITYGDAAPAFSVIATGFAGADSLASCGGLLRYDTNYTQYSAASTLSNTYYASAGSSSLFNSNYNFTYVDGVITVNRKELTVTPEPVSRGYIPGDTAASYQVTVNFANLAGKAKSSDDVYLSSTAVIGTISDPNAGTKSVSYTAPALAGASLGNYYLTILAPNISVDITKIYPTAYSFPASATVPFGSALSFATFSDPGAGDGTFMFLDQSAVPASVGYYPTTYDVIFTPTDYVNYQTVTRKVPLSVTVAELNVAISLSGSLYSGEIISAVVSGVDSTAMNYIHYTWYRVNEENGLEMPIGEDSASYTMTDDDIGYRLKCNVRFDSPYQGNTDVISSRSIQEVQLNFWQKLWAWWYAILAAMQGLFDGIGK